MQPKSLARDFALMLTAGLAGWFSHHANQPVQAASSAPAGDTLAYQVVTGPDRVPSLYIAANHTLYVYPLGTANNHINCIYSLQIDKPGGSIERSNCGIGAPFAH